MSKRFFYLILCDEKSKSIFIFTFLENKIHLSRGYFYSIDLLKNSHYVDVLVSSIRMERLFWTGFLYYLATKL